MDKSKVLQAINKFVMSKYIEKMLTVKTSLLKLYTVFPYTGAANWSNPVSFIMIENLKSIVSFVGANFHN